jgi:hypothetical protein
VLEEAPRHHTKDETISSFAASLTKFRYRHKRRAYGGEPLLTGSPFPGSLQLLAGVALAPAAAQKVPARHYDTSLECPRPSSRLG